MDNSNMNPMQPPMGAPMQPPMGAPMQPMYQPAPAPVAPAAPRADQSKMFSIMAYIPLLFLVGLLVAPECKNPFVKNHVNNGIFVTAATVAGIIFRLLFGLFSISLGELALTFFFTIGFIILIFGMIEAINGKYYYLPVIGKSLVLIK